MSEFTAVWLIYFVVVIAIGVLIGQRKERPLAGAIWGAFLGPLGWLLMFLLPSGAAAKSTECPHCGGVLPLNQPACNHCANRVTWIGQRAVKPSRAAA